METGSYNLVLRQEAKDAYILFPVLIGVGENFGVDPAHYPLLSSKK